MVNLPGGLVKSLGRSFYPDPHPKYEGDMICLECKTEYEDAMYEYSIDIEREDTDGVQEVSNYSSEKNTSRNFLPDLDEVELV